MGEILGFSAGGVGRGGEATRYSNTDRMVQALLEKSGRQSEFVKLAELTYSGCKGCVDRCAKPQVCMLRDDVHPYYPRIKEADAVVIGAPVYFGTANTLALSFVERFFGYRHVSLAIAGKPFVLVVIGAMDVDGAAQQLSNTLTGAFGINLLDTVTLKTKVPPCYRCGRHTECRIGGLYQMLGEGALEFEVTPDVFTRWEDCPEVVEAVDVAAGKLRDL